MTRFVRSARRARRNRERSERHKFDIDGKKTKESEGVKQGIKKHRGFLGVFYVRESRQNKANEESIPIKSGSEK